MAKRKRIMTNKAHKVELLKPQLLFLKLRQKFRAYVGGYRAGKTWAGCTSLIQHALEYPGVYLGYYAPTYPLIRDIFYDTIDRCAHAWQLRTDIRETNKEVHLFSGYRYLTTIMCRSMEAPRKLIGYQHGSCLIDEIDTLTTKKANDAFNKVIARNSIKYDGPSQVNITTTPEGFAFTYNRFVKMVRDRPELKALYSLVQATTYDNEIHLDDDYIPSLLATYTANLAQAYLLGQFVNLVQGTVYHEFDRKLNGSNSVIEDGEIVHVGMDFNVGKMAAVFHVKRQGNPHAVYEIVHGFDTPDMVEKIKAKLWKYENGNYLKDRQIWVYPDSTGGSRKSVQASTTDIQLLIDAGFKVSAPAANPPVKNRVNSLNAMICNANGERRYFVNCDLCPTLSENLEQQAYNLAGDPDKKSDTDHTNDATGYFIHQVYPLIRPLTKLKIGVAT